MALRSRPTRFYDVEAPEVGLALGGLLLACGLATAACGLCVLAGILFRGADPLPWIWIGAALAWPGICLLKRGRMRLKLVRRLSGIFERQGEKPWLLREDWAEGHVRATVVGDRDLLWAVAVGLALWAPVPALQGGPAAPSERAAAAALGVAALGSTLWAVWRTLRVRDHGVPVLRLAETPLVRGRRVAAVVCARGLPADVYMTLRCTQAHVEQAEEDSARVGQDRTRRAKKTVLEHELHATGARRHLAEDESAMPLTLALPQTAPDATPLGAEPITWTLEVGAQHYPWLFCARFELPVFAAAEEDIKECPIPERGR